MSVLTLAFAGGERRSWPEAATSLAVRGAFIDTSIKPNVLSALFSQVRVGELAGSCDLTCGNKAALDAQALCVRLYQYVTFLLQERVGELDLVRHRSHLGARGVQAAEGLQKDRLTPCCYVGCIEVRAKGQR
jgi:hypothetical protein